MLSLSTISNMQYDIYSICMSVLRLITLYILDLKKMANLEALPDHLLASWPLLLWLPPFPLCF